MTRIITLTSGSDGVGKTAIALNLAASLAAAGQRACLLELVADASAASTRLDVPVIATLSDRLSGATGSTPLAITLPAGFDLVTGGTRASWLWDLPAAQLRAMTADLQSLDGYDFLLIDAGSGTAQKQLAFSLASPELWLVVTPEPASLAEAYTRLKLLYAEGYTGQIRIFVNKVKNHTVGRHTYDKFREIASFYLEMQLPLAGMLSQVDDVGLNGLIPPCVADRPALAAEFSKLVDYLLTSSDAPPSRDMVTYGQRYLRAAGETNGDEKDTAMMPAFTDQQPQANLHHQLEALSDQVDELIAEIEQLRKDDAAELIPMPAAARSPAQTGCNPTCIAAMASRSEPMTVQGESFEVYYLPKPDGETQRFAFHSIDDDLEEPEPQTHLS